MKKCIFFFFIFFSLKILPAQDLNRVHGYLDTLCSKDFHGRSAANEGEKKAAEFIEKHFVEAGLSSFKTGWQQPFSFDLNTFPKTLKAKTNKKKLFPGQDFIVNPVSGSGKGKYKLVNLDTLIFTDETARQKFLNSKCSDVAIAYRAKDYKRLTELPLDYVQKVYESPCVIEVQDKKLTASLAGTQYENIFLDVVAEDLEGVTKIKYKVDAKLIKKYQSQNVIGYVRGTENPDSIIIISAHYDHLGGMGDKIYFPGANDNGSGVSMLLELAKYYGKSRGKYTMVFIAFGAEEAGLIGSKYFTDHPLFPLGSIKFMINLDLLGTGEEGMMVVNGAVFTKEFERLQKINEEKQLLPAIKKRGKAANSDHYYFSEKGVPAFFFYTMGGIAAYHDIYDKPETLPLTKFTEVFQLITEFVNAF